MAESQSQPARTTRENEETKASTFNSKVVNGKIRAAMQGIRGQGQSGVFYPGNIDSKTGRPGMEFPRDKQPAMRTQDLADPECSYFEEYKEDPDVAPLEISEEDVIWVARKLSGAAGQSGTDVMAFQSWLLCFFQESASLEEEMAAWTDWISNDSPPWAAYRTIMTAQLVALKNPRGEDGGNQRNVTPSLGQAFPPSRRGVVQGGMWECESLCWPRGWHIGSHTRV